MSGVIGWSYIQHGFYDFLAFQTTILAWILEFEASASNCYLRLFWESFGAKGKMVLGVTSWTKPKSFENHVTTCVCWSVMEPLEGCTATSSFISLGIQHRHCVHPIDALWRRMPLHILSWQCPCLEAPRGSWWREWSFLIMENASVYGSACPTYPTATYELCMVMLPDSPDAVKGGYLQWGTCGYLHILGRSACWYSGIVTFASLSIVECLLHITCAQLGLQGFRHLREPGWQVLLLSISCLKKKQWFGIATIHLLSAFIHGSLCMDMVVVLD